MGQYTLFALFLAFGFLGQAQQYKITDKISDKLIEPHTGILLVKTSKALYGIDAQKDRILWKNPDLKNVNLSDYYQIPFTPISVFEKKPLINSKLVSNALGTKGVSKLLINIFNGEVLLSSEALGFKAVNNTLLLPERHAFLIDGIKDGNYVMALYNFKERHLTWELNVTERQLLPDIKGALLDRERIGLDAGKNIWWLKNKTLLKISGSSGEVVSIQNKVNFYQLDLDKKIIFVFKKGIAEEKINEQTSINAFTTKSLDTLWKGTLDITGNIVETVMDRNELIVIGSKGFSIIDTRTGYPKFKQSTPLPLIKKIVPDTKGSYFVVQDNFLTLVDPHGLEAWDKKTKITRTSAEVPVHLFHQGKGHLLYITPSFANIMDTEKGEKLWKEDLILNDADFITRNLKLREQLFRLWNDGKAEQFLIFAQGDLYILPQDQEAKPDTVHTFEFKGELPKLDIRDKGYLLYARNRFYFFDKTGKLVYEKTFAFDDRKSLLKKTTDILRKSYGTATAVVGFIPTQIDRTFKNVLVSADLGVLSSSASSIYGTYNSYKKTFDDIKGINVLDVDGKLLDILERAKKLEKSDAFKLVVEVKEDDGGIHIFKLNKDTGDAQLVREIDYEYKDFLLDEIGNVAYFFTKGGVIVEKL
ncbi:MAG: hypothetical protein AAGA86_11610 [Bacteroidota bacterium]